MEYWDTMGEGWDEQIHDSLSEDSGGVVQAVIAPHSAAHGVSAQCIVHHLVHRMHTPQCVVQHPVLCIEQAAIAEFCPKSSDAAAIDFGCGVGKYLPLLAQHTVRCLPPALLHAQHAHACCSVRYVHVHVHVHMRPAT